MLADRREPLRIGQIGRGVVAQDEVSGVRRGCDLTDNSGRMEIFRSYAREIADINKGVVHSPRRLNEFSDITDIEFGDSYASCYSDSREQQGEQEIIPDDDYIYDNDDIPESVDWRSQGAVT